MANDLRLGGAIAGGVVGGVSGGPMGAVGGASTGYGAGGMAGDLLGGGAPAAPTMQGSGGAISRRLQAQQAQQAQSNPSADLAAADAALAKAPPEYQQQYGPAIKQARYLDAQQRGMA